MELERDIARELVILSNAIEQVESTLRYYNAIKSRDGDLEHMHDLEDQSERYWLLLNLKDFKLYGEGDIENYYLGYGMTILTRKEVLKILDNKDHFIEKLKSITKDRIFNLFENSPYKIVEILVGHQFMDTKLQAYFSIEVAEYREKIRINDAFMGYSPDNKEDYPSDRYAHMIGLEL